VVSKEFGLSTLSKVFIVILAIMSIVFSILVIQHAAYTKNYQQLAEQYQNWLREEQSLREAGDNQHKVLVLNYNQMLTEQQQQLDRQASEQDKISNDLSRMNNQLLAEQQKNNSLAGQVAQLNALVNTLTQERQALRDQLIGRQKEGSELESLNFKLTQDNEQLRLQKDLSDRQIEQLKEQNFALAERLDQLREKLRGYDPSTADLAAGRVDEKALPIEPVIKAAIYGKVKDVRDGYVAISVGSADGVREGMEFTIYRGGQYLGKLGIAKVRANESAGMVSQVQGTIQAGDDAANRFEH